jgi:hypothetical protein
MEGAEISGRIRNIWSKQKYPEKNAGNMNIWKKYEYLEITGIPKEVGIHGVTRNTGKHKEYTEGTEIQGRSRNTWR